MMIRIDDLSVEYVLPRGRLLAVDGVSLALADGESLGIVGESGSGKSTLAVAVLGLLDASGRIAGGAIRFRGRDTATFGEEEWRTIRGRRIGAIFQSPQDSFNPARTIGWHFEEALRAHFPLASAAAKKRALEALDLVQMPRAAEVMQSYAFELSGGMCQRAALALALVLEPELLIADEPTSSLDLLAQVEIARLLEDLRRRLRLSMMVISHDMGLIGRLADRVAVMHRGRLVETGTTREVFMKPAHAYTDRLLSSLIGLEREPAPMSIPDSASAGASS
jgi:ABC-type dipeptide/oligopeptide/nickel transport system ATPase component